MAAPKYKSIGTSTTSPTDNTKRKEVVIATPKLYSQQVDLSDYIGMDPDTKKAVEFAPYEFRTRSGETLLKGMTDDYGDTGRVFSRKEEELILYVGEGGWQLCMDCIHKNDDRPAIPDDAANEPEPNDSGASDTRNTIPNVPGTASKPTAASAVADGSKDSVSVTVPENDIVYANSNVPGSCVTGSLQLCLVDDHGDPIPNLSFKVLIKQKEVFNGATDTKGQIAPIEGLPLASVFEIRVKKDRSGRNRDGKGEDDYKFVAWGKIQSEENIGCLKSPKTAFEIAVPFHQGAAGQADRHKEKTIQSHNQKPAADPEISGNPDKKPEVKHERDGKGMPKALVVDGLSNMFDMNSNKLPISPVSGDDIEHVLQVIKFGMEQAEWIYPNQPSAIHIKKMTDKKFEIPSNKKEVGKSLGFCTRYVKIALWRAGYGPKSEEIGFGIEPAKDMGPALIKAGFKDITNRIPDARWAAPGDVIVYRWSASEWDKRKKIKGQNYPNMGHIDIRTYDGYLSDFFAKRLPDVAKYEVTGIYRKYGDPMPARRMRAFLMVIASREARAIFETEGYSESYRTLPTRGHTKNKFNGFQSHPFGDVAVGTPSASGAYGILVRTWQIYLPFLDLSPNVNKFTPIVQDRIAITMMEQTQNALAFVRTGEIEKAAQILCVKQWPSLPSGSQSGNFTSADMMKSYNKFLKELE